MPKTSAANKKAAPGKKTAPKTKTFEKTLPKEKPLGKGPVKTPRADDKLLDALTKLVGKIAMKLPRVDQKKLFGCNGFFANGAMFALIWKTGRIGVKLKDAAAYGELRGTKGSDPWNAGPKEMANWVLVPASYREGTKALTRWVERAYRLAGAD